MARRLVALLALSATTHAAQAQTAESTAARSSVLSTVVVVGQRENKDAAGLAGSVDVIDRSELAYEHVDDTLELFSKVPGAYLSRFNQGIINTDVSIRGFAGDGGTPHAKLLIDGIPSNLNSGYGELDQLFPLGIDAIQVFKGTSDPRYGLFNIAGNYNVTTRSDESRALEVTAGSFAAREAQGYAGWQHGRLRHSYFAGYRETEGYRDHTDLEKFAASGQWFYDFSERTSLGLSVRFAGYEGDAPGYLDAQTARSQPRSSAAYANQDGGEKSTEHYSLHFDTGWGDAVDWSVKAYRQHFERERWVRFSAAGSIQNRFDDQWHSGALTSLTWRMSDSWRLNIGADSEQQNNVEQRFGTVGQTRQRNAANVLRDWHYTFESQGAYAQIEHEPTAFIRWNAAVRADRLDGDFAQFSATGVRTTRAIYEFGTIVQPKLNVFITPMDSLTVFANVGRSFQHPFSADAFTTGNVRARDMSLNDGWEAGVHWSPGSVVDARLSYWRQTASDEFVTVDGTPRNVGETERAGFDLAASVRLHETVYLWGNFTTVDSEIVRTSDSLSAYVGNELRSIPDYTASLGVTYEPTESWAIRFHADSQGDYFANEANLGGEFGDYTLVNAGVDYKMGWGKISLSVNNLFDRHYEYVFDFTTTGADIIHSPGDGLNGSVSISFEF